MHTEQAQRHFWLPIPDENAPGGVRHAFRGARWEGFASAEAVCGQLVAMAQPSELDWICFPTCAECNSRLRGE